MSAVAGFLDKNPRPIGELIQGFGNRVVRRRTGVIVRRGSILREALKNFYQPLTWKEANTIVLAARRFIERFYATHDCTIPKSVSDSGKES